MLDNIIGYLIAYMRDSAFLDIFQGYLAVEILEMMKRASFAKMIDEYRFWFLIASTLQSLIFSRAFLWILIQLDNILDLNLQNYLLDEEKCKERFLSLQGVAHALMVASSAVASSELGWSITYWSMLIGMVVYELEHFIKIIDKWLEKAGEIAENSNPAKLKL